MKGIISKFSHPSPHAVSPLGQIGSSVLRSGLATTSSTDISQLFTVSDLQMIFSIILFSLYFSPITNLALYIKSQPSAAFKWKYLALNT